MANEQNLRPGEYKLTVEEAKKGGKASGEARAARRDLRKALEMLLDKNYKTNTGEEISGTEAIALKQIEKAMKGDTRAFEVVRDTIGQKPVDKVMIAEVDQSVIDEVEKAVFEE
jgi:hypothetical protein